MSEFSPLLSKKLIISRKSKNVIIPITVYETIISNTSNVVKLKTSILNNINVENKTPDNAIYLIMCK